MAVAAGRTGRTGRALLRKPRSISRWLLSLRLGGGWGGSGEGKVEMVTERSGDSACLPTCVTQETRTPFFLLQLQWATGAAATSPEGWAQSDSQVKTFSRTWLL